MLRRGEFAVTAELNPPDSANAADVYDRAKVFDGWVDGINAVDASGANCHMSSVGICALLTRMGYAPIMQIACRDRNRIAIQGDVLGGAAMGVANILCLTGDGVQAGDQPGAKPVFDLDCMSLLETIRIMRDNGKFLSGRKLTTPPEVFLGAADQPVRAADRFPPAPARQEDRRRRAVRAEPVLLRRADVPHLHEPHPRPRPHREMLRPVRRRAAGLGQDRALDPLQRARHPHPRRHHQAARRRRRTRRRKASSSASTSSTRCKEIAGVSGVHVMAYRQEEYVAEIVDESGVLKGRQPWQRETRADDRMVADRLDHLLHDDVTETQADMVKTAH